MVSGIGRRARGRGRQMATALLLAIFVAAMVLGLACGFDGEARKTPPNAADTSPTPEASPIARADAAPDAGIDAAKRTCPAGHGAMVLVDALSLVFCIDATEVTNAEYDKFLAATDGGEPIELDAGVPDGCAGNLTFRRLGAGPDAASYPNHPTAGIDWCDAHSFCAWAGKRLCGKTVSLNATTGEWYAACSNGAKQNFPYGATYDTSACNDTADGGDAGTVPVGRPKCQGGVPGLFEMNGNVSELIDNCGPTTCSAMGGDYVATASPGCALAYEYSKTDVRPTLGFRCCADPR